MPYYLVRPPCVAGASTSATSCIVGVAIRARSLALWAPEERGLLLRSGIIVDATIIVRASARERRHYFLCERLHRVDRLEVQEVIGHLEVLHPPCELALEVFESAGQYQR